MYTDLTHLCIPLDSTIHQAVEEMNVSRAGIVMVVEGDRKLVATITEGDVRRAILANIDFNGPIQLLLEQKSGTDRPEPITLDDSADRDSMLRLMQAHDLRLLPLVNEDKQVVDLITLDEFVPQVDLPPQAIIMAGGLGTRLRPLTDDLPKPMLSVGDQPLMEIIIGQLRDAGIKQVNISVHHSPEKITDYFGDGKDFGVEINYLTEERPLGTAGALALMDSPQETVLVMNGDILTQVDFKAMMAYHRESSAELTLAVNRYELQVPYGVIECDGAFVTSITEKPVISSFINAGIYLLEPSIFSEIPQDTYFDMTSLIQNLLDAGRVVSAFPIREYWLDIGEKNDYIQAQKDLESDGIFK